MSEFACKFGHPMMSRDRECPICAENGLPGVKAYTMDGVHYEPEKANYAALTAEVERLKGEIEEARALRELEDQVLCEYFGIQGLPNVDIYIEAISRKRAELERVRRESVRVKSVIKRLEDAELAISWRAMAEHMRRLLRVMRFLDHRAARSTQKGGGNGMS